MGKPHMSKAAWKALEPFTFFLAICGFGTFLLFCMAVGHAFVNWAATPREWRLIGISGVATLLVFLWVRYYANEHARRERDGKPV